MQGNVLAQVGNGQSIFRLQSNNNFQEFLRDRDRRDGKEVRARFTTANARARA